MTTDYSAEYAKKLICKEDVISLIRDGDRIGQLVVARYEKVEWEPVGALPDTERGTGGFGSTGK